MAEGLFPDLQLHHAAISVPNVEEAIAFWRDLFGFEVDHRAEIPQIKAKIAFVRRGDFRIELFEVQGSAPAPEDRRMPNTDLKTQGNKHICFSVEDVQGALEKLHARGVPIAGIMRDFKSAMRLEDDPRLSGDKQPAAAFFFREPGGALVEILRRADFKS